MKVNGGPYDGKDVDIWPHQVGLLLVHRPGGRVWVYDVVDTPDGQQLDVRESEGREINDDKRFVAGDDPQWMVRALDEGQPDEEVGL